MHLYSPPGEISLNKLYNFVLNNLDWLGAQLDWCPALPCNRARAASMAKLTLDIKAPVPSYEVFNPLEELNSIGDSKLSQVSISSTLENTLNVGSCIIQRINKIMNFCICLIIDSLAEYPTLK